MGIRVSSAVVAVVVAIIYLPAEILVAVGTAIVAVVRSVAAVVSRTGPVTQKVVRRASPAVSRASQSEASNAANAVRLNAQLTYQENKYSGKSI